MPATASECGASAGLGTTGCGDSVMNWPCACRALAKGADRVVGISERRRPNGPQRRRQLADAAIDLIGSGGARALSHPRVDAHAGAPPGTTSFYFRTRRALLHAIAQRLTELDVAELSSLSATHPDGVQRLVGSAGLAELVMLSGTHPHLTRTKARYELALHASRDAELMAALRLSVETFYGLAREVVTSWHPDHDRPPAAVIEQQSRAALALVNGVMLSFVAGQPIVHDAAELELLLDGLIAGLTTKALGGKPDA